MRCQLCGHDFDVSNMACHTACPIGSQCSIICCPNCGYQVVDELRSWVVRLLSKWWKDDEADVVAQSMSFRTNDAPRPLNCLLSQVPVGVEVEVEHLSSLAAPGLARLSIFGLIPGSRITVLQHQPVLVVEIGGTQLSLSRDFVDHIWVRTPQSTTALN